MSRAGDQSPEQHAHTFIETVQSLTVAFVLAMTFRGFVTEGFVIPTGSMAPTLFGQHISLRANQTGWEFPVGVDLRRTNQLGPRYKEIADPMLGKRFEGSGVKTHGKPKLRMGDRILVLKCLYPFHMPSRFDVVVFKNPTNPNGDDGNYIKRLIGLPDESIWLIDGDVFVGSAADPRNYDGYRVQRKPEYVQRAVWQPVFYSDYVPKRPESLEARQGYQVPWLPGPHWKTDPTQWGPDRTERQIRTYRCDSAEPSSLEWDHRAMPIDDWAPYNMLNDRRAEPVWISDLRVAAAVVPDQTGLEMTFEISTRDHDFQFILKDGTAQVRMRSRGRSAEWGDEYPDQGWLDASAVEEIDPLPAGRPTNVEFWHVDQALWLFVDGKKVAYLAYDWTPLQRLRYTEGAIEGTEEELASNLRVGPPRLRWRFSGSPLSMHRVRLDRDLYYRTDETDGRSVARNPTNAGFEDRLSSRYAFGTHPENLARLNSDQYFMLGDNSTASSDSRLWGNPHPVVARQIDPSPFVVNRRLLLGKAWVVYFPAPLPITEEGRAMIPDFGRLRFIR